VATPQIMSDRYLNDAETIKKSLSKLRKALDERGYTTPIEVVAEYSLDENFENIINKGDILTFGNNYILIDAFFRNYPSDFREILFNLQIKSYRVVLAQPERSPLIDEKLSSLISFKEKGGYFQVDALSFTGYYGRKAKRIAENMLEAGLIDFIGTNAHHPKQLKSLEKYRFSFDHSGGKTRTCI
jgi:tyrosine-protein phosphatase YwqE